MESRISGRVARKVTALVVLFIAGGLLAADDQTEATRPETTRPETTRPEATRPEATRPEATRPEDTVEQPAPTVERPEAEPATHGRAEPGSAPAAESPVVHLVPVPLPITGEDDIRVKRTIDRLLGDQKTTKPRPVLILEFQPQAGEDAGGSQFERALSLARYLASPRLSRVKTVAYLPDGATGHAVLVAIACEELVLPAKAEFGDAGRQEEQIDSTIAGGYREIASRRRTIPVPVARAMIHKDLVLYRVETLDGVLFVLEDELPKVRAKQVVRAETTVAAAGTLARFNGSDMRHDFTSRLAENRAELAEVLKLPAGSIEADPSLDRKWQAVVVDLSGRVTAKNVNQVERAIRDALGDGKFNFLCVRIDSPGGSPSESVRLANQLAELDSNELRTVAYIEGQARGDAALVAMACDHLVMQDNAVLGGPGDSHLDRDTLNEMRIPIRKIAIAKNRDWSPLLGLLDGELEVHRYQREGTGEERLFSEVELGDQADPGVWQRGDRVELAKGLLARECESLGLARGVLGRFDQLASLYNLEDQPQEVVTPWAITALEQLAAQPWFSRTLLFIAFFALISEASTPGLGAAGFVSGLCFLLFFWAQFLSGNAGWLEILLFLGGVTCVAIEIFVVPGFGIFGVGGAAMVLISIVLASQTFIIPRNAYQLDQLPSSLFMVVFAGAGAGAALIVIRRLLPNAPLLRRMMLAPPAGEEQTEREARESLVSWNYLHGKRGLTTTQLTPSGKAQFGDEVVAVISAGAVVARGVAVRVVEVVGNRVIVEPIEEDVV